jgi:hypothetical protein
MGFSPMTFNQCLTFRPFGLHQANHPGFSRSSALPNVDDHSSVVGLWGFVKAIPRSDYASECISILRSISTHIEECERDPSGTLESWRIQEIEDN